jgi:hypothetical protein
MIYIGCLLVLQCLKNVYFADIKLCKYLARIKNLSIIRRQDQLALKEFFLSHTLYSVEEFVNIT